MEVRPSVTQPDGKVTLTFDREVTVSSVKIGNVDATIVSSRTGRSIEVRVAQLAALGRQSVEVNAESAPEQKTKNAPAQPTKGAPPQPTKGAPPQPSPSAPPQPTESKTWPLNSPIIVAPLIIGLQANKSENPQISRGAVAGGETIIKFSGNIPSDIKEDLKVYIGGKEVSRILDIQDNYLVARVPETADLEPKNQNSYPVLICIANQLMPETKDPNPASATGDTRQSGISDDAEHAALKSCLTNKQVPLDKQLTLRVIPVSSMYLNATLRSLGLLLVIYFLYKLFYKPPAGQQRRWFLTTLLLEQENQTYSLSRAQFLGWLIVIIWAYFFLYYAHGSIEQDWSFPYLGGAIYTFLISLGTLVVAQGSNLGQGVKGAGEVHPSPADLIVHGGVLALDRVQQVLWTLIALGMFLHITVATYSTAKGLPEIPQELLVLMGLSSAGYLGGKLVRGAGPVIEQVTVSEGSVIINIKGRHLSKEGFVWLDGTKQPKDKFTVKSTDPDEPQYATEVEVKLEITMEDWSKADHAITFINDDAQRADWRTGPEIIGVEVSEPDGDGKVTLTIKGARLAKGATLAIAGAPTPTQDTSDPNKFTVKVDQAWATEAHELLVTSDNHKSLYTYKPASPPSEKQPDEKQPDEKQPDEKLPDEKQPEEKQPEEKLPNGGQDGGNQSGSEQVGGGGATVDNAQSVAGEPPTGGEEIKEGEPTVPDGQTGDGEETANTP